MIKEKINGILNKIKNNKKKVIGVTIGVFAAFIFTFAVYNLNNPTYFNRLFASIGSVPNENFNDTNFYSCVVDAYNSANGTSKAYTDNLTDDELSSIKKINCYSKNIEDTKGIEKLNGLTELSLNNNLFTNIDLTNNTLLEKLSINNEKVDNELASIDISNNTLLKDLDLSNNSLSTVDLSNNTSLTDLDLHSNQLASIDLSNNTSLTTLDLIFNQLTSLDLSNNTSLTDLDLSENQLTSIDLSNNVNLRELNLDVNPLTSINGMENLTELTTLNLEGDQLTELNLNNNTKLINLYLYDNQLTSIDLSNNTSLTALDLSENQLTSIDLSNNTNLSSLHIDGTSLIEDILIQNGETYIIEEKIIPPSGQNFSYSVNDTSVASVSGNIITALKEGSTRLVTRFGNVSFERKLVVGVVELKPEDINVQINNEENYIYFKEINSYLISDEEELTYVLRPNVGKIVRDDDTLKVVVGDKTYLEYKMVYFDGGALGTDDSADYSVVIASTEEPTKYNIKAVNCTYEFANDGKEVIIKYNGNEIDRKKLVYMYLPYDYKFAFTLLYFGNNILDSSIINNIDDVSQIDKNKVNILNAKMTYKTDDGTYLDIKDGDERVSEYYPLYIYSDSYDLIKNYIYLGTNDFDNNIQIFDSEHDKNKDTFLIINNDNLLISAESISVYSWSLIKVTSDKYDMSGDTINLGNEDIDLTKINVTNATLKVDNNKLLIMYGDEVVKEFKLEGGKKTTTTTKKDDEKPTATKDKTTTKEEVKTTTTKKKVSIIDKIFGNKETTTIKKEEATTKKNIFRKSTTTKVENSSGNVTSNNKNSFKKLVTGSNLLILFLSITGIALIIYIIIDKKKIKNNN